MQMIKRLIPFILVWLYIAGCAGAGSTMENSTPHRSSYRSDQSSSNALSSKTLIPSSKSPQHVRLVIDNQYMVRDYSRGGAHGSIIRNFTRAVSGVNFVLEYERSMTRALAANGVVVSDTAGAIYTLEINKLSMIAGASDLGPHFIKSDVSIIIFSSDGTRLADKSISHKTTVPGGFSSRSNVIQMQIKKHISEVADHVAQEEALLGRIEIANQHHKQRKSSGVESAASEFKPSIQAKPAAIGSELDFGNYHALVIGNNNYKSLPNLKTAINDATAIARLLQQQYGFVTQMLIDATRSEILMALNTLRKQLTVNDNLLIYFAGHGWLDRAGDEGYWLPVDADPDIEINWISNSYITTTLRAMSAKHVLIVADSCYSGKLTRGLNLKDRNATYLLRIAKKRARTVLSSGGLEPVIDSGGKNNHSVFAAAFIDALLENDGIADGTQIFTRIRRPVMLNANQTPEYSDIRLAGHDGGDFLFVRTNIRDRQ
jgi:hypothetical protein